MTTVDSIINGIYIAGGWTLYVRAVLAAPRLLKNGSRLKRRLAAVIPVVAVFTGLRAVIIPWSSLEWGVIVGMLIAGIGQWGDDEGNITKELPQSTAP